MDKFFTIFGKISLTLIIFGGLIYGAYYFGTQSSKFEKPEAINTTNNNPDEKVISVTTPIATEKPQITIVAGVQKSAGLSFNQYSIVTPDDWTSKKESQTPMDEKLVLSKNGYEISIFQAATGGALCLYPGDADFEGPSSRFDVFEVLSTKDSKVLRRSGNKNGLAFTVCQRSMDNSYQQPTTYGHISIKIPQAWTEPMMKEIDAIISSLKTIN